MLRLYKAVECIDTDYFNTIMLIPSEPAHRYCPVCYSDKIKPDEETWAPVCECGWTGNYTDCVDENLAKNVKRTKLIDEMLNK